MWLIQNQKIIKIFCYPCNSALTDDTGQFLTPSVFLTTHSTITRQKKKPLTARPMGAFLSSWWLGHCENYPQEQVHKSDFGQHQNYLVKRNIKLREYGEPIVNTSQQQMCDSSMLL